jgi:GT2 family glycosyltransferase
MTPAQPWLTAVVCTRDRPRRLDATLDALTAERADGLTIVVVDQGETLDSALDRRAVARELELVRDAGHGLSRARNLAARCASTQWLAFVDDDCVVEPGFASAARAVVDGHPEAVFVSPHVDAPDDGATDGLTVTGFPVEREVTRCGRWTAPWLVGFGVCFLVRRNWIERLGGWDERLGAGTTAFPAAEDMDFQYRLLREGGITVASPAMRVAHTQWRTPEELVVLAGRYALASGGLTAKHIRLGDVVGGAWLAGLEARAGARMLASAFRRRSRLRARVAVARLHGQLVGTARGLARRW